MTTQPKLNLNLVFKLIDWCNLRCTYCNVGAGPRLAHDRFDPELFEAWILAFASLRPDEIGVQLHGGEPLLADPPVEVYAAIAKNALRTYTRDQIVAPHVVTNGTVLDEKRLASLKAVGIRLAVSIDGPAWIHDTNRINEAGRGSHRHAMRGLNVVRSGGLQANVICVVSDPDHVLPIVQFFIEQDLRRARINFVRPEGRGRDLLAGAGTGFSEEMARSFFEAAVYASCHNREHPDRPFREANTAAYLRFLERERTDGDEVEQINCALLVERDSVWAHPGGAGLEAMRVAHKEAPSPALAARILGLEGGTASGPALGQVGQRRKQLFRPCSTCPGLEFCTVQGFPGDQGLPDGNPSCAFNHEFLARLRAWVEAEPAAVTQALRG